MTLLIVSVQHHIRGDVIILSLRSLIFNKDSPVHLEGLSAKLLTISYISPEIFNEALFSITK